MIQFFKNLVSTLNEEYNVSITENGAIGYRTTGNDLLDLNFSVSSLRNVQDEEVIKAFAKAFFSDKKIAVKWLFFAGDVRGGLGERRLFRLGLTFLSFQEPDLALKVLKFVPEYTRWDNCLVLLDSPIRKNVVELLKNQIEKDVQDKNAGKQISLLAKWMPSINASSEKSRKLALTLVSAFGWSAKTYRKTLAELRAYLKVVEVSMSANQWSEIDYETVPSRANLIYKDAFARNDPERRFEFLKKLQLGEAKINSSVLFPHDIVSKYSDGEIWIQKLKPLDVTLENLWRALPDYVQGNNSTICVADGSGSMGVTIRNTNVTALNVANALAIYFAERCTGVFKDKYITFSEHPQLVDFSSCQSLHDKIGVALTYNEVANTNIEAVFNLILDSAKKTKMKQEEMPQNILILSDMEFDEATGYDDLDEKLFKTIEGKFEASGYKLPRIVFWNILSRTRTIPLTQNELGVALVSGFSPTVLNMVLSNKLDPLEVLLDQLNSERYQAIEDALNS